MLALGPVDRQAQAQGADRRVALVIGNANYPDAEAPLKEPVADARALAAELRRAGVGFDVEIGENLSKDDMLRAFNRFYAKIVPGSTALVFFSGYAIQAGRQSFVIPVDGQIWRETDVSRDGFSLEQILREMNSRGAAVKVAILDASRRNPYERRIRKFSTGLAPVDTPPGSLVMYSSAPSTVTDDGRGEQRLFVTELVKQLRNAGGTAEEVFNRTRLSVSQSTNGQQVPWVSNSLISVFSFDQTKMASAPPVVPAPVAAPVSPPAAAARPQSASAPAAPRPEMPAMAPVVPPAASGATPAPPTPSAQAASAAPRPAPAQTNVAAATPAPASPAPTPPSAVTMPPSDLAAIQEMTRRIRSNPNDAAALFRRGQLYAKNNDFTPAAADFDATIRLSPRDAEALNNRCWVRAVIGDLQAALSDCDASLQIQPNSADSLDSRGFVKLKMGQADAAIADYEEALKLSPRKASSLYGRGIARLRMGNAAGQSDITEARAIDRTIAEEFARYGIR